MRYDLATLQILGTRSNQEDGHWNSRQVKPILHSTPAADPDTEVLHFIVADGMGGYAGGERASAICIETTAAAHRGELEFTPPLSTATADSDLDYLELVMNECHFNIVNAADNDPLLHKMGSTAVIGVLTHRGLALVSCGDSRAYLLRGGVLQQLTTDQTIAQLLLAAGQIKPEEVRTHPRRHVLSYVLGRHVFAQRVQMGLQAGDKVLVCTDGLTDALADTVIAQTLSAAGTAEELCAQLIAAAQTANPKDNTTVTVVTVN